MISLSMSNCGHFSVVCKLTDYNNRPRILPNITLSKHTALINTLATFSTRGQCDTSSGCIVFEEHSLVTFIIIKFPSVFDSSRLTWYGTM